MYTWSALDPQARALLSAHGAEHAVVVFPRVVRAVGPSGAILLAFLLRQARERADGDGWFAVRAEDVLAATGLTRYIYQSGREALASAGVARHERRGMPATTHFRVDFDAALAIACREGDQQTGLLDCSKLIGGSPVCGDAANNNAANKFVANQQTGDSKAPTRRDCPVCGGVSLACACVRASARVTGTNKKKEKELEVPVSGKEPVPVPVAGPEPESAPQIRGAGIPESRDPEPEVAPPLPPAPLAPAALERAERRVHAQALKPPPVAIANGWIAAELELLKAVFTTGINSQGRVIAEGGYPSRRMGNRLLRPTRADLESLSEVPRSRSSDLLKALRAYADSWRGRPDEERQYVKTLRKWITDGTWEDWVDTVVVKKSEPKWEPIKLIDGHMNPYDFMKTMPMAPIPDDTNESRAS